MKPISELSKILADLLILNIGKIDLNKKESIYYNSELGDTSFLLGAILWQLLKKKSADWEKEKWIDDSLITQIEVNDKIYVIGGVMIWGKDGTTEQWTDPFQVKVEFQVDKVHLKNFTFFFGDKNYPSLTYEVYRFQRDYWNKVNRNWNYIIEYNGEE